MTNIRRPLQLTRSRAEEAFPILTPAQIFRVATHGRSRMTQSGEVLVEQGDSAVPFFVVVSGEVEVVRPLDGAETLVAVFGPGQFTGEVNILSGRRALFRIHVAQPGEFQPGGRRFLIISSGPLFVDIWIEVRLSWRPQQDGKYPPAEH